jgi:hypothetical protein
VNLSLSLSDAVIILGAIVSVAIAYSCDHPETISRWFSRRNS